MTVDELQDLIHEIKAQKFEKQRIEVKEANKGTPKRLYATLSYFANQPKGGIIVFGISEEEDYSVVGVYDVQDLQDKVTEQCKQMSPQIRPLFTVAEVDGKYVVSAVITETDIFDKPCFYMGAGRLRGSFQRVGNQDIHMTEYEIYSYEVFKRKINDELRVAERADMDALNANAIAEYFSKLRQEKPNLDNLSETQLMKFQGITDNGKPTLAGIMLFGLYPQGFFPQLSITAMVVPGYEIAITNTEERFIDNKRIDGTIIQMFDGAMNFIRRNMRVKTIIDKRTAERRDEAEYPIKAIREILMNCLIHRDYSIHTEGSPIRIVMYKDRIEVENPGGLYGRLTIDELGTASADTRNPFIANMLEIMIKSENRFSGIPTIIAKMKEAKLPPPIFESRRGVFKVTLYNGESGNTVVQPKTRGLISEIEIREFCKIPRTRKELADRFNIDSQHYLIRRYIQPLVDNGVLRMTLPNTPKSKNQQYVLK